MRHSYWILALALLGKAFAAEPSCPPVGNANTSPTFDASLLKEGRFIYRTSRKDVSFGETAIEVRRVGEQYRITMSAPEIAQSWSATLQESFAPLSAELSMKGKKGAYAMKLQYAGPEVTGEEREGDVTRPVKALVEGVVVDQRVDWAAMMAIKAPAEGSLVLRVFDPSSGSSEMLGKIGGSNGQQLRLDYTICKREHVEAYTVYATSETPRYMLREDMPNGLVSELVRIEP